MNIAQALKTKNRLAGQVARLEQRLIQHNQHVKEVEPEFNIKEVMVELIAARTTLSEIRTAIQRANHDIMDKLVQLAEAKADLAFWQGFADHHSGPAEYAIMRRKMGENGYVDAPEVHVNEIDTKTATNNVDVLQERVNNLQDEIDAYNATTQV
jgi:hypothetical protein